MAQEHAPGVTAIPNRRTVRDGEGERTPTHTRAECSACVTADLGQEGAEPCSGHDDLGVGTFAGG